MPAFDKFTYQGEPFRGEFTAVDPSTQVLNTEPGHRFSLFVAGSTVAITLATGDRAMISDWVITSASADTFYIYDGADINADVGERLVTVRTVAGELTLTKSMQTPIVCQSASYPKMIGLTTASNVSASIYGVVKRAV